LPKRLKVAGTQSFKDAKDALGAFASHEYPLGLHDIKIVQLMYESLVINSHK
jgi:hypothetical protein